MEFKEFAKIPRLSREIVITEKIDGTNGVLHIGESGEFLVGSRTRWLDEHTDNFGFWHWAQANKAALMTLAPGTHYGEWWGSGIQRGYGLLKGEKHFSLFDVSRWCLANETPKRIKTADPRIEKYQERLPDCCSLVPILWEGIFDTREVEKQLEILKLNGSFASPGFMKPEGVVIYHRAGNLMFKKTIEKDEEYKGKN